jgi:MarR family transcriptional regulator, 2-MHQ and catechol-resistance regulon repressor
MSITAPEQRRSPRGTLPVLERSASLDRETLELHRALSDLVRVYQFRDRDRICCYDVSVSQCYALEAILLHGPLTLNEVAAHMYLDKSTTSRVVDALQKKGYVERRENPDDRRALHLEATEAGRDLHARIEADILAQEKELLAGFSPEVRQSMARLIGELARAAAARVDTSGGSCCTIAPSA